MKHIVICKTCNICKTKNPPRQQFQLIIANYAHMPERYAVLFVSSLQTNDSRCILHVVAFSLIVMRTVNKVCDRLARSGIVQSYTRGLPAPAMCLCLPWRSSIHAYILFAEEVKISVNTSVCHAGAYPRLGILIPLFAGRWRLLDGNCNILSCKNFHFLPDTTIHNAPEQV